MSLGFGGAPAPTFSLNSPPVSPNIFSPAILAAELCRVQTSEGLKGGNGVMYSIK